MCPRVSVGYSMPGSWDTNTCGQASVHHGSGEASMQTRKPDLGEGTGTHPNNHTLSHFCAGHATPFACQTLRKSVHLVEYTYTFWFPPLP